MIRLETGCYVEDQIAGKWMGEALGCKSAQDLQKGMLVHHGLDHGVQQPGGVAAGGQKRDTGPRPPCLAHERAQVGVQECLCLFLTLNFP